jgi:hypothetical protein
MAILSTSTFTGSIPTPPYVPPPVATAPQITLPDPLSYEFQVIEYVENDKVVKVELQVKQNSHDQWGNIKIPGTWKPVPRIQVNK